MNQYQIVSLSNLTTYTANIGSVDLRALKLLAVKVGGLKKKSAARPWPHSTVFLQRGSCIYSEKSYGMSHGSYYKIFMILRWPELEFSKIDVFRAF